MSDSDYGGIFFDDSENDDIENDGSENDYSDENNFRDEYDIPEFDFDEETYLRDFNPGVNAFSSEVGVRPRRYQILLADLEKGVDPGILDPRKYLCCKKVFSPNPAFLLTI